MGEKVEYATIKGTASGWLALPAGKGNGKGVLVLQEMWGLVPHIIDVAERFARAGYVAFAPDLWNGKVGTTMDESYRMFLALRIDQADAQLRGAVEVLHARGAATKLGVVGFCLGGQLAMYTACTQPDAIGACVNFYGIHPDVNPDFDRLAAPILGIFGTRDPHVTTADAHALELEVGAASKQFTALHYDADHAFFNDTRPEVYDEACAEDAWKRTLGFFEQNL